MAFFTYACLEHGEFKANLPKRERVKMCPICGLASKVVIKKAGNAVVVEVMDDGLMARSVERIVDIEQIMKERSQNSPQDQTTEIVGTPKEESEPEQE